MENTADPVLLTKYTAFFATVMGDKERINFHKLPESGYYGYQDAPRMLFGRKSTGPCLTPIRAPGGFSGY
jgi:hypothetical protein